MVVVTIGIVVIEIVLTKISFAEANNKTFFEANKVIFSALFSTGLAS